MTKTKLGQQDVKPTEMTPAPVYTAVHLNDSEQQGAPVELKGNACWYVCGILSTIFCCLPCGIVGLVHAMIAKHEGERGNHSAYRRRMYQAKCWTSWAITLGLLTVLACVLCTIGATIGFRRTYDLICGYEFRDYGNWNGTAWNETEWMY